MLKSKKYFKFKNIAVFFSVVMFFVLDRILKLKAIGNHEEINLISGFLKFKFFANQYISFSIPFQGIFLNIFLFILISLIIVRIIFLIKKKEIRESFFWFIVLLGAISNFIDRIRFSFVVDYLDFLNIMVFNIADVLIVLGCFLILLFNFKNTKK